MLDQCYLIDLSHTQNKENTWLKHTHDGYEELEQVEAAETYPSSRCRLLEIG